MRKIGIILGLVTLIMLIGVGEAQTSQGGSGTEADPYQISTCEELQAMKNDLGAHYILVNDIDASETVIWNDGKGFEPIGDCTDHPTCSAAFGGGFDGKGHTITGLYINSGKLNYVGMFGFSKGTIENVGLEDINVRGRGLVGGLVGLNDGGDITTSYITGTVVGNRQIVGGLVGHNSGGTIKNCYAKVNVSSHNWSVGGLVAENVGGGVIENCYATGTVSDDMLVGGLVGYNPNATIKNSYATGSVTGSSQVGGLVGRNSGLGFPGNGTIINCYYNNHAGNPSVGIGYGPGDCTAINDNESYFYYSSNPPMSNWDFVNIWGELPPDYPYLLWEEHHHPPVAEADFIPLDMKKKDKGLFEIIARATDPDDNLVPVVAVIELPSLDGRITLEVDEEMVIKFEPEKGKVLIKGPNPAALLAEIQEHGGFLVEDGQKIYVKITGHSKYKLMFEDDILHVEAPEVTLRVTATDTECLSHTATASPPFEPAEERVSVDVDTKYWGDGNYDLRIAADGTPGDISSITISGPHIGTATVHVGGGDPDHLYDDGNHGDGEANDGIWLVLLGIVGIPAEGETIIFDIAYSHGPSETKQKSIDGVLSETAQLSSPPDGSTVSTLTPTFEWNNPPVSGLTYSVQVDDTDHNRVYDVYDLLDGTTSHEIPTSDYLNWEETYYWLVSAFDANGNEALTNGYTFTTSDTAATSLAQPKFGLSQNYPNPFNPETTIEYNINTDCDVTLKIYNLAGQLIKTLVNEYQTAGNYTTIWYGDTDAGGEVASGVYFYQIRAGEFVSIKKMVVLK